MAKKRKSVSTQREEAARDLLDLALDLYNADVGSSDNMLSRAQHEIARFISAAPRGEPGFDTSGLWVGGSNAPAVTTEDVITLQNAVRALLDAVARGGPPREDQLWRPALRPVVHADGRVQLAVDEGSVHDRYLLALVGRLNQLGANSVRACGVCGRAFVRRTRGLYCPNPECNRAVGRARWHKGKHKYRPPRKQKPSRRAMKEKRA